MKKIYQIIALLVLIGCSATNQDSLESNSTITTVFNESEIQDLERILEFFNEQICTTQQVDKNNLIDCYKSFFERMSESVNMGSIEIKIPFDEQQYMYKQISDSTFNQIWAFNKVWKYNTTDTLKEIGIKYDCKYVDYLEQLGKDYEVINNYYDGFKSIGDIGPHRVADLLVNYHNYNTKDIRIRLVVAIHYLTLNDRNERMEKY